MSWKYNSWEWEWDFWIFFDTLHNRKILWQLNIYMRPLIYHISSWKTKDSFPSNHIIFYGFISLFTFQTLYKIEILTVFRSYFGRNHEFKDSFWNLQTFNMTQVEFLLRKFRRHKSYEITILNAVTGTNFHCYNVYNVPLFIMHNDSKVIESILIGKYYCFSK